MIIPLIKTPHLSIKRILRNHRINTTIQRLKTRPSIPPQPLHRTQQNLLRRTNRVHKHTSHKTKNNPLSMLPHRKPPKPKNNKKFLATPHPTTTTRQKRPLKPQNKHHPPRKTDKRQKRGANLRKN